MRRKRRYFLKINDPGRQNLTENNSRKLKKVNPNGNISRLTGSIRSPQNEQDTGGGGECFHKLPLP